jgi:cellulose synthase/poly-beta-1,6-N-acetylglucosamine synthase-like glycosyltransferase
VKSLSATERIAAGASGFATVLSAHTFVNRSFLRRPSPNAREVGEPVTVCIPARNEGSNIEACVRSVLATTGVSQLRVLVLNDGSTDETGLIVSGIAERDSRLELITGTSDVPEGWIGKTNALQQLFQQSTCTYVVFVDADVRLEPNALRASIDLLEQFRLDLVSPYPKQVARTAGERLMQPLLQWLWLTFLPLRLAERTKPASMVAANGQFMVARRSALASVGGFELVRGEVLDDVALGRVLKRAGFRVTVVDGTSLATCHMYTSWSELRDGYTKNLWSATGSPAGAVALGSMLTFAYLVPPIAGLAGVALGRRRLALLGGVGTIAGIVGRIISAQTTGGRVADSVGHPLSILGLLTLISRSWRFRRRGLITWKGRSL